MPSLSLTGSNDSPANIVTLSVTGLPVGAVPCGHDANGMPVGLQVVGRQFGEEQVLALSRAVEIVTNEHG